MSSPTPTGACSADLPEVIASRVRKQSATKPSGSLVASTAVLGWIWPTRFVEQALLAPEPARWPCRAECVRWRLSVVAGAVLDAFQDRAAVHHDRLAAEAEGRSSLASTTTYLIRGAGDLSFAGAGAVAGFGPGGHERPAPMFSIRAVAL